MTPRGPAPDATAPPHPRTCAPSCLAWALVIGVLALVAVYGGQIGGHR